MRLGYEFASRLDYTEPLNASIGALKRSILKLKEDYCFDVEFGVEYRFGFSVIIPKGYNEHRKEWLLECLDYIKPLGVELIVEER